MKRGGGHDSMKQSSMDLERTPGGNFLTLSLSFSFPLFLSFSSFKIFYLYHQLPYLISATLFYIDWYLGFRSF